MADAISRVATVGNVTYKAVAAPFPAARFDGVQIGLIRYVTDPASRTSESHYWTLKGWVKFPNGGEYGSVRIHFTQWPDAAYELLGHMREPEALRVLSAVIEEAKKLKANASDQR